MDVIFSCFHGNLAYKWTIKLHVVGSGRVHGCHLSWDVPKGGACLACMMGSCKFLSTRIQGPVLEFLSYGDLRLRF